MEVLSTSFPDVKIFIPEIFQDTRGFLFESYSRKSLALPSSLEFVQDNHSKSNPYVLRGIHYQLKYPQGKLIRVVSGMVLDVAVDLRKSSPTFGKWVSEVLSAENRRQLWIPPGYGHAFLVLGKKPAEVLYKVTEVYLPNCDRCIRWDDPDLNILWPPFYRDKIITSEKDAKGRFLKEAEAYL